MLLGRRLRASDNLMQLCIHGGTIKYRDLQEACGPKPENPKCTPETPNAERDPCARCQHGLTFDLQEVADSDLQELVGLGGWLLTCKRCLTFDLQEVLRFCGC